MKILKTLDYSTTCVNFHGYCFLGSETRTQVEKIARNAYNRTGFIPGSRKWNFPGASYFTSSVLNDWFFGKDRKWRP